MVVDDFVGTFNVSSDIIGFFGREKDHNLPWPTTLDNKSVSQKLGTLLHGDLSQKHHAVICSGCQGSLMC